MRPIKVRSLRDLEDQVANLARNAPKHRFCFRGHRDARWQLIPSAFRAPKMKRPIEDTDYAFFAQIERDTYREFDSESRTLLHRLPLIEQMAVAQHHGVPTRCLDWTTDIHVAAFFAVPAPDDSDAAICVLDLSAFPFPSELGRQHRSGGFMLPKLSHYGKGNRPSFAQDVSRPLVNFFGTAPADPPPPPSTFVVVHPPRECSRLRQQKGLLSWYHSFSDGDFVADYTAHIRGIERSHHLHLLTKLVIPKRLRSDLRQQLRRAGVTPFTLFPDLDGLGRHLSEAHDEEITQTFT